MEGRRHAQNVPSGEERIFARVRKLEDMEKNHSRKEKTPKLWPIQGLSQSASYRPTEEAQSTGH